MPGNTEAKNSSTCRWVAELGCWIRVLYRVSTHFHWF